MVVIAYPGERHEDIVPVQFTDTEENALAWIAYRERETVYISAEHFWTRENRNFLHKPVMFSSDGVDTGYILVIQTQNRG